MNVLKTFHRRFRKDYKNEREGGNTNPTISITSHSCARCDELHKLVLEMKVHLEVLRDILVLVDKKYLRDRPERVSFQKYITRTAMLIHKARR